MHEVGLLVWVVLIVVGVVSSIVANARKARTGGYTPQAFTPAAYEPPEIVATQPQTRVLPPPPPPPRRRPTAASPAPPPPAMHPAAAHRQRFFRDHRALVRAVVGAEVLGKPLALRDE